MAPKAGGKKDAGTPKKETTTTGQVGGTTNFSGQSGGTRLQIVLDAKTVTPQPLAVTQISEKGRGLKPLESQFDGDTSSLKQGTGLGLHEAHGGEGKADLNEVISKHLTETETTTLFSVPSLCVALDDTDLHGAISAKNKKYEELLVQKRNAADQYRGQHQQTLNALMKTKEILALPPKTSTVGVEATEWDIHDSFVTKAIPRHQQIEASTVRDTELLVESALKKKGCLFPLGSGEAADSGGGGIEWTLREDKDIECMQYVASVMEKSIVQNVFHGQHMTYRNYPTLEQLAKDDAKWKAAATDGCGGAESDIEKRIGELGDGDAGAPEGGEAPAAEGEQKRPQEGAEVAAAETGEPEDPTKPALRDLFSFTAPQVTKGLATTNAEWNAHQQDLLAVAYGDTSATVDSIAARRRKEDTQGLILFWSLKNPSYPERILKTTAGVSSLAFSETHPSMIAAGMIDGTVAIWDSRRQSQHPVLISGSSVSTQNDRKHTDCVWEVKWANQSQGGSAQAGQMENLVSVSGDGRVFQWTMRKGLEQKTLMSLKRLPNPHLGSNAFRQAEGSAASYQGGQFRKAAGMAVDVLDSSSYLVATDDGFVHRCSVSHNEQYLESFSGHSGGVYRVRCNPFYPSIFLTCSIDWTVRLWSCKNNLVFSKSRREVDTPSEIDGMSAAGDENVATRAHPTHESILLKSPLISTFQSPDLTQTVQDVVWHPQNSASFASCMNDGRVELWDLAVKPHDPLVVHHPSSLSGTDRTFIRFARESPVLVCGDGEGTVAVMRSYNTEQVTELNSQEQVDRLLTVIAQNESKK